jgi:hypothetical protein
VDSNEIKILLVGDTFLRTGDDESPFDDVAETFRNHDLVLLNLETTITDRDNPVGVKAVSLCSPPENLRWLSPFRDRVVVSLANNHTFDYGRNGFQDTEQWLQKSEIRFAPPDRPFHLNINGRNLNLHCIYEYMPDDYQRSFFSSRRKLPLDFSSDAIDIVFVHWGEEHVLLPSPKQIMLAKRWRDAGADIVVGHHSHAAQGMQVSAKNTIAYSLGNFNFRQLREQTTSLNSIGFMLLVKLTNGVMTSKRIPYYIDEKYRPRLASRLSDYFTALDRALDEYTAHNRFAMNVAYLRHSSRSYIVNNLKHGFLPRLRSAGIGQLPATLKWLLHPRTLLRYPFMLSRRDRIWQLYHRQCEEQ